MTCSPPCRICCRTHLPYNLIFSTTRRKYKTNSHRATQVCATTGDYVDLDRVRRQAQQQESSECRQNAASRGDTRNRK